MNDALKDFGWDARWEETYRAQSQAEDIPARVVEDRGSSFHLLTADGDLPAVISGRLKHSAESRAELPVVGDWVVARRPPGESKAAVRAVLPRRAALSRKGAGNRTDEQVIAANVDTVFVVTSFNMDLNERRIERYLSLVWESGARPVILVNKADLCADPAPRLAEIAAASADVPVLAVSAVTGQGLDALAAHLVPAATAALIGSSGVGKSTLVNRLLGREALKVAPVREGDDRGRHTTSHRALFRLPAGALVIDTPGLRELSLWTEGEGLAQTFSDVESFAGQCHFNDCRHREEKGCGVLAAVASGDLLEDRYQSWLKLQREAEYLARRRDVRARLDYKKKSKQQSREIKRMFHRGPTTRDPKDK
jgi:ribosome biogenesis GTPase